MIDLATLQPCDVLAIGPHPDDVEIAAAGTLLLLGQAGHAVSIVDCTRGEMGSAGSVEQRDAEAAAAATALGLRQRLNLGLPDANLHADDGTTDLLVGVIRAARPRLLFAPLAIDPHPDHVAAADATTRAFFLAGLKKHRPERGEAFRPTTLLRYPLNRPVEPTIAIDISAVADQKAAVVRCYGSQIAPPDRSHLLQGVDLLERTEIRDRFHGARIGVRAAEPFCHDGPLALRGDIGSLLSP